MEAVSNPPTPVAAPVASHPPVRARPAALILLIALIAGAWLRFYGLGALQMSADEGASWAAAHAPSIRDVIAIQATHNAGKLPFHDILLHGWIAMFGDGLYAMRALSALFGVLTLLVVAPATREVIRTGHDASTPVLTDETAQVVAAIASLLCAVNVVFIKYDVQARMYALLLTASVAQVWFFLRTIRTRSALDGAALALLTAATIAASLVSAPLLATEGIWLLILIARGQIRAVLTAVAAMLAGLIALSPALYHLALVDVPMVQRGIVNWLEKPPWWEPVAFFSKALGSFGFPVLAALAGFGCVRQWVRMKAGVEFVLLWMWAPPVLLVIGSYLWRPMFVERYALYSFPPFFMLAAIGICSLRELRARSVAAVLAIAFSLGHFHSYWQRPHDTDWRAASRIATAALAPGQTAAVLPDYAVEVVRYYALAPLRQYALPYRAGQNKTILVLGDQFHRGPARNEVEREFPRVLGRFRGVIVRSR